ncbi:MAG TPA: hypothetical protein VG204_10335 [Terriglobia bacterium]|nr:hypothetical protein [Terriglobia bacterium]
MQRSGWMCHPRGTVPILIAYLLSATAAVSQQTPSRPAAPAAGIDPLGDLKVQIRQLTATVAEMNDQMAWSRREAQELHQELQAAREQLASFKRELAESRAQAARSAIAAIPGSENRATAEAHPAEKMAVSSGPAAPGRGGEGSGLGKRVNGLDDRVTSLEESQQLLGAKVDDQYQSKVESGSKYRVRLSGIALLNVFGTRGSVDNLDVPTLARPREPLDSSGSFGATLRQTQLGLEVFGPRVGGARTSGDLQFDFFGGFPDTQDGVTAGLVRLRTSTVRFDWAHTSIVAGQDAPFFSPLSPSSLASLAYPALAYSGNLWTWTPQVVVERRRVLSDDSSILVQGGILDSLTGEPPADQFYRLPQAGERSRQPAYATRVAWTRGALGHPLTLGAGGYYARQDWGFGRSVDAWAGTADWELPLGRWLSLTGELYRGRGIGGLGAATGRSVLFSGSPTDPRTSLVGLNAAGGWSQLKFKPLEKLEVNGAFGEDYPFGSDLARFPQGQSYVDPSIGRSASAFVNGIYHLRSNLLFSLEYRKLWTSESYRTKVAADHVNVGVGVLF